MVKKPRRVRTFARTATKSQEKNLIENAKLIRKDPHVVIPKSTDSLCEKYLLKQKKKLEKILRFKDDKDKLEKLSNKKGLEGALAGTLYLAISEKAPYLGVLKFPTGDVTYAQRGKADKQMLIAFQHFNDPVLRLFGIKDLALKKNLNVYSWDAGFVCTGKEPNPPTDFVKFLVKKLNLKTEENVFYCGDLNINKIKEKKIDNKHYIRINWKSANVIFAICKDCVDSKKNTIFDISKYMIEPNLAGDFSIDVIAQAIKQKDESLQDTRFVDEYLSGKINDLEFINKNVSHQEKSLKESDEKVLVLDGVSYGTDINGFVEKLSPKDYERPALEFFLERIDEPLIISDASPNKILDKYWRDYGEDYISNTIDDSDMASSFHKLDDTPTNILKTVFEYKDRQDILSKLPKFSKLPPLASFADNVTRTYKVFGKKKAIVEIKKRPDNSKSRSMAFAFLLALDKASETKWKYSKDEIEFGEFLKEYASNLLESDPKNYTKRLQDFLTAIGSNEKID